MIVSDCHSAAPPSPFRRCFNRDGESEKQKWPCSPTAKVADVRNRHCHVIARTAVLRPCVGPNPQTRDASQRAAAAAGVPSWRFGPRTAGDPAVLACQPGDGGLLRAGLAGGAFELHRRRDLMQAVIGQWKVKE